MATGREETRPGAGSPRSVLSLGDLEAFNPRLWASVPPVQTKGLEDTISPVLSCTGKPLRRDCPSPILVLGRTDSLPLTNLSSDAATSGSAVSQEVNALRTAGRRRWRTSPTGPVWWGLLHGLLSC